MRTCAYLVVGSGKTGLEIVRSLEYTKKSIILVEKNLLGGQYVQNEEYPYDLAREVARDFQTSLRIFKNYSTTFKTLQKYRQGISDLLEKRREIKRSQIIDELEKYPKLELVRGNARFISPSLVEVMHEGVRELISFEICVLATGKQSSKRVKTDWLENQSIPVLDDVNIFRIESLPESLLISGCTRHSLTIAELYAELGVKVIIVEKNRPEDCLSQLDRTVFNYMVKNLMKKQVDFYFRTDVAEIINQNNTFTCILRDSTRIDITHVYIPSHKIFVDTVEGRNVGFKSNNSGFVVDSSGKINGSNNVYALGEASQSSVLGSLTVFNQFLSGHTKYTNPSRENSRISKQNEMLGVQLRESSNFYAYQTSISEVGYDSAITIGLTEDKAINQFGPQVSKETIELQDKSLVKCLYKIQNGTLIGVSLMGQAVRQLVLISHLCVEKKLTIQEFKQFIKTYQYILS